MNNNNKPVCWSLQILAVFPSLLAGRIQTWRCLMTCNRKRHCPQIKHSFPDPRYRSLHTNIDRQFHKDRSCPDKHIHSQTHRLRTDVHTPTSSAGTHRHCLMHRCTWTRGASPRRNQRTPQPSAGCRFQLWRWHTNASLRLCSPWHTHSRWGDFSYSLGCNSTQYMVG